MLYIDSAVGNRTSVCRHQLSEWRLADRRINNRDVQSSLETPKTLLLDCCTKKLTETYILLVFIAYHNPITFTSLYLFLFCSCCVLTTEFIR